MTREALGDTLGRRAAWYTLSNVGAKVVTFGVWFFLTPFILHQVGATKYGLWALVGSMAAYGTLLDLGIGPAVTKYVAEFHAQGEDDSACRVIATAFWLYAAIGVVVVVAAAAFAPFVPDLFNVPPPDRATAEWLTFATGVAIAIELPTSTTYAALRGLERFPEISVVSTVAMLFLAPATVLALVLGGGLVAVVAVNIALTILIQMPMVRIVHRALPGAGFHPRHVDRHLVRTIFGFSAAVFGIDAAAKVSTKTDEIVIGLFLPVARITPYTVARRLSTLPQLVAAQFEAVLLPLASGLKARSEHERLRSLAIDGTRLTLVSFLPVACGLAVLSEPFLSAWLGAEYAYDSRVVVILVAASLVAMSIWPASSVLQAMSRHRPLALFALGGAALNLGLSIAVVRPYGVTGVAFATLVASVLEVVFFVAPFAMRVIDVKLSMLLREVLVPVSLPVLPTLGVLFVLRSTLNLDSLLSVIFAGALGGLVYVLLYLAVAARPAEKEAAGKLLARMVMRSRPTRDE